MDRKIKTIIERRQRKWNGYTWKKSQNHIAALIWNEKGKGKVQTIVGRKILQQTKENIGLQRSEVKNKANDKHN